MTNPTPREIQLVEAALKAAAEQCEKNMRGNPFGIVHMTCIEITDAIRSLDPAAIVASVPKPAEQAAITGSAAEIHSALKKSWTQPVKRISPAKKRKEIAAEKLSVLREAAERIRTKARETPAWDKAYFSAITAIELLEQEIKNEG